MNTYFWLAVSTIGPVTFLAIGVFEIDVIRGGGLPPAQSSKRTVVDASVNAAEPFTPAKDEPRSSW